VHVPGSQSTPLDIAKLVEHEQRVVAGTAEMAVVGAARRSFGSVVKYRKITAF
jgi:hypothetical protein